MAVKQLKVIIQDARDYFPWAISSPRENEYQLIIPEEYEHSNSEIEQRKKELKSVKGIFATCIHSVVTDGQNNTL